MCVVKGIAQRDVISKVVRFHSFHQNQHEFNDEHCCACKRGGPLCHSNAPDMVHFDRLRRTLEFALQSRLDKDLSLLFSCAHVFLIKNQEFGPVLKVS